MSTVSPAPRPRDAVSTLPPYRAGRRATPASAAALASNENHFPPLPSVLAEIAETVGRLNRYPDSAAVVLRERIAGHVGVAADEVAVGPGSVGVCCSRSSSPSATPATRWSSPGVPSRRTSLLVALVGATPVPASLTADERHDLPAMADAVGPRTRLVLLCTPGNPTGITITGPDLDRFLDRAPSDVLAVVDEAYLEYVVGDRLDTLSRFRQRPSVCLRRTFSKAYGLAGLRVGYAIASRPVAAAISRTGAPFGVNSVGPGRRHRLVGRPRTNSANGLPKWPRNAIG